MKFVLLQNIMFKWKFQPKSKSR